MMKTGTLKAVLRHSFTHPRTPWYGSTGLTTIQLLPPPPPPLQCIQRRAGRRGTSVVGPFGCDARVSSSCGRRAGPDPRAGARGCRPSSPSSRARTLRRRQQRGGVSGGSAHPAPAQRAGLGRERHRCAFARSCVRGSWARPAEAVCGGCVNACMHARMHASRRRWRNSQN
jgi:hypothetical protein